MKLPWTKTPKPTRRIHPTVGKVGKRSIFETGTLPQGIRGPDGKVYSGDVGASLPGFLASLQPADTSIRKSLRSLRRASRVESARGGHLRAAVMTFRREVVGSGLMLRSLHPAREVRMALESAWRKWGMDCDVTGQRSWRQLCHSAVSSLVVDGEAILRLHYGDSMADGIGVELVDAVRLQVEANSPGFGSASSNVVMGVEMDRLNKPIAYWISDRQLGAGTGGGSYSFTSHPMHRVPAALVLHVYDAAEYPGMVRGVPLVFAALKRLSDIRLYDDAERKAARKGSEVYGIYEPPPGAHVGLDSGSEKDEGEIELVGDGIAEIEPGGSLDFHSPTHPNAQYGDFMTTQLMNVASALGVSYASLTGDLSRANFVSSRLGRLAERGTVMMMRELLVERMAMPLFRQWLMRAYASGLFPRVPIEELEAVEFVGPSMVHVQPREMAAADHQRLADGLVSRSELIRESGREPADVFAEIEDEGSDAPAAEAEEAPEGDDRGRVVPLRRGA